MFALHRVMINLTVLILIAQSVAPPTDVKVFDTPNDAGGSITITWNLSTADTGNAVAFKGYEIHRSENPGGPFENIGFELLGKSTYEDKQVKDKKSYYYFLRAAGAEGGSDSQIIGPVRSRPQWFNTGRINALVILGLFSGLVLFYIERAKKNKNIFIRKIAGLDAIEEAVGRSTEMGRPMLFSFGLGYITDVVTIAALSILGRIAKKAAQYETPILIPNNDPIVMAAAQETVKQAYTEAGRPDLYNPDYITFLTTDQFGYAAGVDGILLREKPGAVFWQGYFYAESLILAETGNSIGAIQIAGTTAIMQLPFFIAACDYTLIGEEMYAASSYLTREPIMLGSLKGEDMAKVLIIAVLAFAAVFGTVSLFIPKLGTIFSGFARWFNM